MLTELAVSSTDSLATVGTRDVGGPRMWVSRWNPDGQLTSEHEVGDGTASEGHAIAFGEGDSLYIGGGVVANGEVKSWMRKLDAQNDELWTAQPMHLGLGVTAAIAVDPWGEVVTVSTQACSLDGENLTDCDLVVRKYDDEGTLMWFEIWDAENFVGPVANLPGFDASLAIDRFGYIYVTAIVYNVNTGTN